MFDNSALRGFVNTLTVNASAMNATAAKAAMVRAAEAARNRVLSGTPKPSSYRQVVDGKLGADLTSVRPDGVIIFAWQYLGEVVSRIHQLVVVSSPRVTGQYIAGIIVLADGEEVEPTAIPANAAKVHIVASVPYARRLEIGHRKGGAPFVIQVPYKNIEHLAMVARQLYKNLADISFTYVDLTDAYVHGRNPKEWNYRRPTRKEIVVRYPAILIEPRTA